MDNEHMSRFLTSQVIKEMPVKQLRNTFSYLIVGKDLEGWQCQLFVMMCRHSSSHLSQVRI